MDNHNQFIAAIEENYGMTYQPGLSFDMLQEYLSKKSPDELRWLLNNVVIKHSKNWKSLPDITIFHKIESENKTSSIKIQAEKAWQLLLPISSLHDVLIVDPVAHFVVRGFGSWDSFCLARDGEYRELTHKDFIERYENACKAGVNEPPYRLAGFLREEYSSRHLGIKCRIVGDQAEGHRLLSCKTKNMLPEVQRAIQETYQKMEGDNETVKQDRD